MASLSGGILHLSGAIVKMPGFRRIGLMGADRIQRTTAAGSDDQLSEIRPEGCDLIGVIADLDLPVIDDDRPFQDGRILDDEGGQFLQGHRIEIGLLFLHDLGTLGDDLAGAQIAFFQDVEDILLGQISPEDVDGDERDALFLKVGFDLSTGGAKW